MPPFNLLPAISLFSGCFTGKKFTYRGKEHFVIFHNEEQGFSVEVPLIVKVRKCEPFKYNLLCNIIIYFIRIT